MNLDLFRVELLIAHRDISGLLDYIDKLEKGGKIPQKQRDAIAEVCERNRYRFGIIAGILLSKDSKETK